MSEKSSLSARRHSDKELQELCRILVGVDRQQLQTAVHRLENRQQFIEHLSGVLADSIRQGDARDERLRQALAPLIASGVKETIKRDPATFGEALAPAMGPAIRESVMQTVRGFVEGFERVMEHSLSPKSLKWRVQSWRTGKPFAEIVFLHTIAFRVEHVFLIHRSTGLMLERASRPEVESKEPEVVSAMLTAIQEFVRDAFHSQEGDTLDSFKVGDQYVWIEHTNRSILAAVIRGQARQQIRQQFRASLEHIELQFNEQINDFDGDVSAFTSAHGELERCLLEKQVAGESEDEKKTNPMRIVLGLIGGALLIWLVVWWIGDYRDARRFEDLVAKLDAEPGIVVTASERSGGRYRVKGLHDPLAPAPETFALGCGVDPKRLDGTWERYQALHPDLIVRRLHKALGPPRSVRMHLSQGVLHIEGTAHHAWIRRARDLGAVVGVERIDRTRLEDSDVSGFDAATKSIRELKLTLRSLPGGGLDYQRFEESALVAEVVRLLRHAQVLGRTVTLTCRAEGAIDLAAELPSLRAAVERLRRSLRERASDVSLRLRETQPAGAKAKTKPPYLVFDVDDR